jgi:hypothetical protein
MSIAGAWVICRVTGNVYWDFRDRKYTSDVRMRRGLSCHNVMAECFRIASKPKWAALTDERTIPRVRFEKFGLVRRRSRLSFMRPDFQDFDAGR